jgi:asparagine synthase (glutamine-hydrolysing)
MHFGTDRGLVLGRVAAAGGSPVQALGGVEGDEPAKIAQHFVRNFWGSYVSAYFSPPGGLAIWRAPLGDLPCYVMQRGSDLLLASSPRLLAPHAARPLRICSDALARHLAFTHLRPQETCLDGIEELAGGQCLTWSTEGIRRSRLWSPWTSAARKAAITDPGDASSRLRAVARQCVAAGAGSDGGVLLKLSGGLDSSIVAACLAHAGIHFRALTLVTDDAAGDERPYARMVARHLGVELIEARRDPARIDPSMSPARDLPRPSIPLFRQESERISAEAAAKSGLTGVMDGGGGDNVFCSLQSASPVADCLLSRAGWGRAASTAASLAEIARVSLPRVLRAAISRALRPSRSFRWPVEPEFLSQEAVADLPARPAHPWLNAPRGSLPGRAAHVALIAAGQSYVEGLDPEDDPPLAVPLLAQPLVELCLRIPSWLWFERGLNRAVARRAFSGELPGAILHRRSKGTPDSFLAQIFELHRRRIRDELLGGELASLGLLDRPALVAFFDSGRPLPDGRLQRIMALYDTEIWCRSWPG